MANEPVTGNVLTLQINQLVENLFRGYSSKTVAMLTRIFGTAHLELAEEVVQESLLKAVKSWPLTGIPSNPEGWLYTTAKHLAIDALRRESSWKNKKKELSYQLENTFTLTIDNLDNQQIKDDQLKMMFICCHPALPHEVKICLSLKTLCGFSVAEIAKALLANEKTIAQRIVRAKRKIKEADLPFELPPDHSVTDRIDAVLDIIYLLFNEGYAASQGEELIRAELCYEAIRLGTLLATHPVGNIPKTHALLALLLFQASRLATRTDEGGCLLLLQEQDRSQWDQKLIQAGFYHLHLSQKGNELTLYHVQAGIAACHATAKSHADTDWASIVWYYEQLLSISPSPVFAFNRAIAIAYLSGAEAGLQELLSLENDPFLQSYYLYYAALAAFSAQVGQYKTATDYYLEAIHLATTKPEKEYLMKKLDMLSAAYK